MASYLSTSLFAMILVLVNLALASSDLRSYDVRELGKETLIFTDDNIVSEEKAARHFDQSRATRFIGDLVVGSRRAGEQLYEGSFTVTNPTSEVYSGQLSLSAKGIVHFVSILNEPGSQIVVCDTSYTLGSSIVRVNIRALPNSRSYISVLAAAH